MLSDKMNKTHVYKSQQGSIDLLADIITAMNHFFIENTFKVFME